MKDWFYSIIAFVLIFGCLVFMPIFTFGYAAVHVKDPCGDHIYPHQCDSVDRSFAGFGAAIVWPLYWSWEIQEK